MNESTFGDLKEYVYLEYGLYVCTGRSLSSVSKYHTLNGTCIHPRFVHFEIRNIKKKISMVCGIFLFIAITGLPCLIM